MFTHPLFHFVTLMIHLKRDISNLDSSCRDVCLLVSRAYYVEPHSDEVDNSIDPRAISRYLADKQGDKLVNSEPPYEMSTHVMFYSQ